jgi:hypothetical protein
MKFFGSRVRLIAAVSFGWLTAIVACETRAEMIGAIVPPTITISAEGFNGPAWRYSPAVEVLENLPGHGRKLGIPTALAHIQGNRASVVISELAFDPDPFVLNNILITNTTAVTQIYTVGLALPTVFGGPNLISGNVRADVIDGGGGPGATLATVPGFPMYAAQIDFGTVATLHNDPTSVIAPSSGSASLPGSFGPLFNPIAVSSNIGIQLRFSLSAGDTAAILSRFDVVAVPEPSTIAIAVCGVSLLIAVKRGRRRVPGDSH